VSLADAKAQLGMNVTDHTYDDLLRDYLAGITGALEDYKHEIIVRRTITDRLNLCGRGYGARQFRLWSAPVISLTSVASWDGAITWDVTQMVVSPSGVVRVMGGPPVTGLVDAAYIAGLQQIPGRYKRGGLVMLEHVWESQRGQLTARSGVMGPEEHVRDYPGEFFTVPNKAREWLGPPRPVIA